MLICMRTTLNLDDALMREAKQRAAATGRTLTALVERALRELLMREQAQEQAPYRLEWVVVDGEIRDGVVLHDRDALMDVMDADG